MRKMIAVAALPLVVIVAARALAAGTVPAAPPPGPGLDLINQRCVFCHNTGQIFSQHKTPAAWSATVEQMANRGAEVSPDEEKIIVDYLAKNYGGADKSAPPPPHG
jgi:hypothetical protein